MKSSIDIDKMDAALIIKEDMEIQMVLPHLESDHPISENILFITLIGKLLNTKNEKFREFLSNEMDKLLLEIEEQEKIEEEEDSKTIIH